MFTGISPPPPQKLTNVSTPTGLKKEYSEPIPINHDKIYYRMSPNFLQIWSLCKRFPPRSRKLAYSSSISVTLMHEKQNARTGSIQKGRMSNIYQQLQKYQHE